MFSCKCFELASLRFALEIAEAVHTPLPEGPGMTRLCSKMCFLVSWTFTFIHRDREYLGFLKQVFEKYGIGELIFTSDGGRELVDGTLPGVFETVNFQIMADKNLDILEKRQPGECSL